jgi:hypothetical protein
MPRRNIGQVRQSDKEDAAPAALRRARSRIMYIENKSGGLDSAGRIGRVYFSKTGQSLYYAGRTFRSLKGNGFKSNYFDVATGEKFWISGPRKDGNVRLYGGNAGVEVDPDVADAFRDLVRRW